MRGFFRLPFGRQTFEGYSISNLNQYDRIATEYAEGRLGRLEQRLSTYEIEPVTLDEISYIKHKWKQIDAQEKLLHQMGRPADVEIKYICACGYLYATIRAYKVHRKQTGKYCKLHRVR